MMTILPRIGRISFVYLLRHAWRNTEGRRIWLVTAYAFFIIGNGIRMLEPLLLARALNVIQEGGEDVLPRATLYLSCYVGITFAFWIFHGSARLMERHNGFHARMQMMNRLFGAIHALPLRWHREHHSGETINLVTRSSGAIGLFTERGYEYVSTAMKLVFAVGAIVWFVPFYGSIALTLCACMLFVTTRIDRRLARYRRTIVAHERKVGSALVDYLGNITTVITLRLGQTARSELNGRLLRVLPFHLKNIRLNEAKWFMNSMTVSLMTFGLLLFYVRQELAGGGAVMVGSMMALYQYAGALADAFFRLAGQLDELVWHRTDVQSTESIERAHAALAAPAFPGILPHAWRTIEVRDVSFAYGGGRGGNLQSVSLRLGRGRRIALIGESGSGKSTLLSVLHGLERAETGSIVIDGAPAPIALLTGGTTLIPQQPELFANTLMFNITTGLPSTTDEVRAVCELACFTPVLDRIPQGLKADIRERGINLSGGQRQRLALARGILAARDSSVILMDEPTSSVDPANELAIYRNVFRHFSDRCIVSSVHRMHLLPLFDDIIVMDQGRAAETGTFDELINREDSRLRTMWNRYVIPHDTGAQTSIPAGDMPEPVETRNPKPVTQNP